VKAQRNKNAVREKGKKLEKNRDAKENEPMYQINVPSIL
jgi:hypothetical protein